MDRILITGGTGQVGSALVRLLEAAGVPAYAPRRNEFDLSDETNIAGFFRQTAWRAVINCAAYTAVDRAEDEPAIAALINARVPGILAAEAARQAIPIIHVSTDYVFDGAKADPYVETDRTNPLGTYGRTKLDGEHAVRAANPCHAIVRTAWVLSPNGANFLNTMLRLGNERPEIGVVDDQLGCPTSADDIAQALYKILTELDGRGGTWHFVNSGSGSWFDLATLIFAIAERAGTAVPKLRAISTSDYPTKARRPANSRLATDLVEREFGLAPRHWRDAVEAIMIAKFPTSLESES